MGVSLILIEVDVPAWWDMIVVENLFHAWLLKQGLLIDRMVFWFVSHVFHRQYGCAPGASRPLCVAISREQFA